MNNVVNYGYTIDSKIRKQKSYRAVNLGLAANISLAAAKTGVGILGHSPALLADGINSTSDVAYYLVVAVFMRLAGKPPDDSHPYGHNQLESIASLVVGAFVVATGIAIFWEAINNVFDLFSGRSAFAGAEPIALLIALLTVVVKIILTYLTHRMAAQTNNPAVFALAHDHRNDVFSAFGAMIGIFLGRRGLPWVDPLVGALVALLVLRTGVQIIRQSSDELMDTVPSRALAKQVIRLVADIPQVRRIEELHAHRFGPYLVVNITIGVDGALTVTQGDKIACQVEDLVYNSIDLVRRVYVHFHPEVPTARNGREAEKEMPALECRLD